MWGRVSDPAGRSAAPQRTPRVLIHAVAGGVGTAAVQIGRLLGVDMYGTSSSDEKLARVKALGLQHGINYKQHDYEEVVKNLTHGEGVDAVFEMLGGEHTAKSLRCLRDFGRVIQYGTATGKAPQLDIRAMYAKSASVQGLWLTYLSHKQEIMDPAWQQLSAWIGEGKLNPPDRPSLPTRPRPRSLQAPPGRQKLRQSRPEDRMTELQVRPCRALRDRAGTLTSLDLVHSRVFGARSGILTLPLQISAQSSLLFEHPNLAHQEIRRRAHHDRNRIGD